MSGEWDLDASLAAAIEAAEEARDDWDEPETFDDVMRPRSADTYHRGQAVNWRATQARSLLLRIRSDVGDLADALADLTPTTQEQADDLRDHMRAAARTLREAEVALAERGIQ